MRAPDYNTIYEFEKLLSATIESLFNADEIKAIGVSEASDDLQKDRPRVEVFISIGPGLGHFVVTPDGIRRENGWHSTLHLNCITAPDYVLHSKYIAAVRELASRLDRLDLSNNQVVKTTLDFHEITQTKTSGTNSQIKGDSGYYESILSYEMMFAIRADAWPDGINAVQPLT